MLSAVAGLAFAVGPAQAALPSLNDCRGMADWERGKEFIRWECNAKNWTEFPDPTLFNATSNLQLTDNHITTLPDSLAAGGGLVNLTDLYLENNELTEIIGSAFDGLINLKTLMLSGNKLKGTLGASVFAYMPALYSLHIDRNMIDGFAPGTFDNNKFLFLLTLYNNSIKTYPPHLFDQNRDLTIWDLHSTDLVSLPKALLYKVTGLIGGEISFGGVDAPLTPLSCKNTPIDGPDGLYFTECICSPPDPSVPLTLTNDPDDNVCCIPAGQEKCLTGLAPPPGPSPTPSPGPSPAPSPGPSPAPSPGPSPGGSKTKAGPVIGALVGLIVFGAAGFFLYKEVGGKSNTRAAAYAVMNNDEDDDIFSGSA